MKKIKGERTGNPKIDYERDFVVRKIITGRRNPIQKARINKKNSGFEMGLNLFCYVLCVCVWMESILFK